MSWCIVVMKKNFYWPIVDILLATWFLGDAITIHNSGFNRLSRTFTHSEIFKPVINRPLKQYDLHELMLYQHKHSFWKSLDFKIQTNANHRVIIQYGVMFITEDYPNKHRCTVATHIGHK